MNVSIPDFQALLGAAHAANTNKGSYLHGDVHWRCVAWTALGLLPEVPDADPAVAFLFALFHDCQRLDDGFDRDHGRRAADYLAGVHGELFTLEPHLLGKLIDACRAHADGQTTSDPTIGVCWDADRLNLWRIDVRPHPRFLSTAVARRSEVIDVAADLRGRHRSWTELYDHYVQFSRDAAAK